MTRPAGIDDELRSRVHKLHNNIAAIRMYADLLDHEFSEKARAAHGNDVEEIRLAADCALELARSICNEFFDVLDPVRHAASGA
jgi:hypothetical protein